MALAILYSRAARGIEAPQVTIETHISNGLPSFSIVGMAETAVKESKDRVRSAILNTHFDFPPRRITVNLAPADLPKTSGRYDLPIALSILVASEQLPSTQLADYEWAGELALSGELRPVTGILPFALKTLANRRNLVVPQDNADEAALPQALQVYPASHILQVCAHVTGQQRLTRYRGEPTSQTSRYTVDYAEVKGQHHAKRALTIAAAGGHSVLMRGPPGTGKSMLAARLPTILPELSEEEALMRAAVRSLNGHSFDPATWRQRPFRAPHHTASSVALVGGGRPPKPGEISLAHNGVLFLDELPEFNRDVLEALREPLETGEVTISRASHHVSFPARFQCIAAMNPCPCGYYGDPDGQCRCTPEQIQRYQSKISGPLLDRFDLQFDVPRPPVHAFTDAESAPSLTSQTLKAQVVAAQQRQKARNGEFLNAMLMGEALDRCCMLADEAQSLLHTAVDRLRLSARAYYRILRVARTIADLQASDTISQSHISEALSYRHK